LHDRGDRGGGDLRVVPVRPRDRPPAEPLLRLLADGAARRTRDARLRLVLLRSPRAAADQAQAGGVPRAVPRLAAGAVSAVGLHRARSYPARAEDGDPVRRLLDGPVRPRGAGRLLDPPEGPELPPRLRRQPVRPP